MKRINEGLIQSIRPSDAEFKILDDDADGYKPDVFKGAYYEQEKEKLIKRKIADAQLSADRADMAKLFGEIEAIMHEPLPSTRLSNRFAVVIRESFNTLKSRYLEVKE